MIADRDLWVMNQANEFFNRLFLGELSGMARRDTFALYLECLKRWGEELLPGPEERKV